MRLTSFAVLLCAAFVLQIPAAAQAQDVVRIGVLNDQSGPYGDFGGRTSVIAAQMAVEDFGGKVLGKPVEIVAGDHQNKPDIASSIARRWFDVDNVSAVTDLTNSAVALAVHVPLAALAGILLFVAWNMGEWHEFARLRNFSPQYRTILVGTFVLTVVFDLTVAVEVGLVLACVFFIWRMGQLFSVRPHAPQPLPEGVAAFELFGSLFFGAVGKIEALPAQLPEGTRALVLEMHRLISMDTSGLEALQQLHRTLKRRDVGLVLANVNDQPLSLIRRSGFEAVIGADAIVPNVGEAVEQFG